MRLSMKTLAIFSMALYLTCSIMPAQEAAGTDAAAQAQQPASGMLEEEAREIVKRCYLKVLHREADPAGLETHARHMVESGLDETALETILAQSPERAALVRKIRKKRITLGVGIALALLVGLVLFYPERDDPEDEDERESGDPATA